MANENKSIEVLSRFDFQRYVLKANAPAAALFASGRDQGIRNLAPKFRNLAGEFAGRINFVIVDAGVADRLDADYAIKRTPTVLLFEGGKEIRRWTNELNTEVYRKAFEELLSPAR